MLMISTSLGAMMFSIRFLFSQGKMFFIRLKRPGDKVILRMQHFNFWVFFFHSFNVIFGHPALFTWWDVKWVGPNPGPIIFPDRACKSKGAQPSPNALPAHRVGLGRPGPISWCLLGFLLCNTGVRPSPIKVELHSSFICVGLGRVGSADQN